MRWTLTIDMDSSLSAVRKAAAVFREAIAGVGTLDVRQNLELALVEACTNSAKHGSQGKEDAEIRVTIEVDLRLVRVTVEDCGKPFDPAKSVRLVESRDIATMPTGGMGLTLIREIFDRVKNEPQGGRNKLVLEKRIGAPADAAPAAARSH